MIILRRLGFHVTSPVFSVNSAVRNSRSYSTINLWWTERYWPVYNFTVYISPESTNISISTL